MRKKLIYLFIIVIFVSLINILTLIYIKETEFPFIALFYKETAGSFNYNNLDLEMPISREFKQKVSDDLGLVLENKKDDIFFVSSILAEYVRSHLFHKSNIIDNVDKILESQEEYPAICSGYAQFLASIAQALGYQARVIWLDGHTVSEIYFSDYGWVLIDTSGNLIFQDKDGNYVSLLYVVEHFEDVTPKRIAVRTENDPDALSSGNPAVFNKNKIIVVIEGPRLFDFFVRTKSPSVLINYILGREDVAKGIQYTANGREKLGNLRACITALIIFDISYFIIIIFICYLFFKKKKYVWDSWNLGL